jgi:adenine phosphoribosyltransferase
MHTYPIDVAGLHRELPICKVADDLYIGALIMFGDAELTVACARELLKLVPGAEYDYMLTAEAKSIPLIHEMARQSGAEKYFVARKGMKVYLTNPLKVSVRSITTQAEQHLYLSGDDAAMLKGRRVLLVDDVISTGESMLALETLASEAGAAVVDRIAVLAEGGAAKRKDIKYLKPLPVFNADGTPKA